MSAEQSRRAILRWSALGAFGALSAAAPLNAGARLRLPSDPMILSRKLVRDLNDGEQIIIGRSWAIQFHRNSRRIEIAGHQASANVQAPPKLRTLADLEQNRRADGMFPLILSDSGLLVSGTAGAASAAIKEAINSAKQMISESHLALGEQARVNRHLLQMQQAAQPLIETMPADLFFPSKPPVHEIQPVHLADGMVGEFELSYEAVSDPQGGWLDHAERRIVTRLGTSERQSIEYWALELA